MKEITFKVVGGKLLRIRAELKNNFLKRVKITGDFFLHPEEKIEELENSLREKELEKEELEETIAGVVERENITLLGVSQEDFIEALLKLKE